MRLLVGLRAVAMSLLIVSGGNAYAIRRRPSLAHVSHLSRQLKCQWKETKKMATRLQGRLHRSTEKLSEERMIAQALAHSELAGYLMTLQLEQAYAEPYWDHTLAIKKILPDFTLQAHLGPLGRGQSFDGRKISEVIYLPSGIFSSVHFINIAELDQPNQIGPSRERGSSVAGQGTESQVDLELKQMRYLKDETGGHPVVPNR